MKRYTITALVSNKSGVLTRISGLFARRGFNIESLCACTTENQALSRMTIVLNGDEYVLAQLTKQLDKLIDVKKIALASENESVCDSDELTPRLSPQFSEELTPFAVICDVPEESVLLEE